MSTTTRDTEGGDAEALIERFGAQMLETARRYSRSDEDADDAYQRAAEIAVRRRPSGSPDDLRRWLRTTAKREALRIGRRRPGPADLAASDRSPAPHPPESHGDASDTHRRVEQLERLRLGGEALHRLKPQEIRALTLHALGYSYAEIGELNGWSYTKVDRCLKEGRRDFLRHLALIESGAECVRLAPLVAEVAAGGAPAAAAAELRPHLASCLVCRASLRRHRER